MQEDPADDRGPHTSTPRRGQYEDETVPDFGSSTEFEDTPLEDYNGPVEEDSVDNTAPVEKLSVRVPTLRPLSKIGNNSLILARRSEALAKGATGTGKDFLLGASKASRRLFQYVFPKELEMLDTLLTEVERLEVYGKDGGFRVEKTRYRLLLRILQRLRARAEDAFRIDGKTPPPLPTWGDDEDIFNVYEKNAFEILGVCFRVEVENFLVLLDKYYNFSEGKPHDRHVELDEEAEQFIKSSRTPSVAWQPERANHPSYEASENISKASASTTYPLRNTSARWGAAVSNTGLPRNNARMGEILNPLAGRNPGVRTPPGFQRGGAPPAGDPDDGNDDDDEDDRRYPNRRRSIPSRLPGDRNSGGAGIKNSGSGTSSTKEAHFDVKLKYDSVPKWDGNVDTIIRWIMKVNNIARESATVFQQLGRAVPKRLEGDAEIWYWSLPIAYRSEIEKNWDTLKQAFSTYYLNRKWLDRQRGRANRATYRDSGHARETPSEYFIRKTDLLNTVYTMDDSEIILEVMDGAPSTWNTILTTQMYRDIVEFQSAIRYHEDALMKLDRHDRELLYRDRERERYRDNNQQNRDRPARANLVGWSANIGPPQFPKDDRNVSQKATPESKGARPCRHCGSGKHWDNECKHSFKGNKSARTNLASSTGDDLQAQDEYNDLYYGLDSDEGSSVEESNQGFEKPLQ
ncbi:hypothetical protein K438DRAFT_1580944, partial [Mycena galopus ATCC 62051]